MAKRGAFIVAGALSALTVVYAASLVLRSARVYRHLKASQRGWTDGVFTADPQLGFAPVPGRSGQELLPGQPPIPVSFDGDALRVPAGGNGPRRRPLVLALGCSWTYGAACRAEEAYPFLVARELQATALNAAVPSYGLTQMALLARRLLPRFQPEYLLVQYSDWLVERGREGYAPVQAGVLPTPFFVARADGRIAIHRPVFPVKAFALPLGRYRGTSAGPADFASFVVRAGGPMHAHDDFQLVRVALRRRTGALPDQAAPAEQAFAAGYEDIAAAARASGARLVFVLLGPQPAAGRLAALRALGTVADAQQALCAGAPGGCPHPFPTANEGYRRVYGHWSGTPPAFVDPHPNPRAHAAIATEVVSAIRATEAGGGPQPRAALRTASSR